MLCGRRCAGSAFTRWCPSGPRGRSRAVIRALSSRFGEWVVTFDSLYPGSKRSAHRSDAYFDSSPLGYGVIGNTAVSGTAILGSSPGTPASR